MIVGIDGNEANVQNRVGTGVYALELIKQLAKLYSYSSSERSESRSNNESSRQARTIKFIVYLKEPPLPDLPKETSNFKYFVFGPKKLWTQFALPIKLTVGPKIDVFFSTAHYGPRFSKVPYVVTIHDLSYLHFPKMFKKDDLAQLTSWSKYSIEKSTHIIVPSKNTKDDIVKNYNVPASKITVTYEGYDKSRFNPQPQTRSLLVRKKYKIEGDYIIFVGTLQPRKNIERLIEAFASFAKGRTLNKQQPGQGSTLSLVIAGKKGWMYDSILNAAKELGVEKNVIFTDFVPDEDLPALISGAKIYVNPSLWEGFGIPVIEAQACGIPVAVSNTSSLPEIVGDSGILVNPENIDSIASGIRKALDPKTRFNLVEAGFENIKRFSWEKCAKETIKVLEGAAK